MPTQPQLHIALIQSPLVWEDVEANLAHFTQLLTQAQAADIYVLPEMFTTGFSMQPQKFAKQSYTKGLLWLKQMAAQKNAAIMGSIMVEDAGKYYNRLFFVTPHQSVSTYDKKHLFSLGNEQHHYTAGNTKLMVDYLGWKICPMVCYDLRFPVWCRNSNDYDVLLFVANWPQKRIHHWQSLLVARAIENQCYVIACNRVGDDANQIAHNGNSMVVDYNGQILQTAVNEPAIVYQTITKDALHNYRNAFPFLSDRDTFSVN